MNPITVNVRGRMLTVPYCEKRLCWAVRVPGSVRQLGGCDLCIDSWASKWPDAPRDSYACAIESTEAASRYGALPTWSICSNGNSYQDAVNNAAEQVAKLGKFFGGKQ